MDSNKTTSGEPHDEAEWTPKTFTEKEVSTYLYSPGRMSDDLRERINQLEVQDPGNEIFRRAVAAELFAREFRNTTWEQARKLLNEEGVE